MAVNKLYDYLFRRTDAMIPLRKGLDAYATRQKAHAANLANAETPGYRAIKVDFEDQLRDAVNRRLSGLTRSREDHIPVRPGLRRLDAVMPRVVDADTPENHNGVNNVDIDREMARIATNQIQFATASKIMQIRFRMLKSAISGSKV